MKFDPRINNLLSEQDEKRHADLRAKLMPGYTAKEVPALEQKIDNRILDVINLVQREYVDRNESLDFAKIVQYFTLDSLTDVSENRSRNAGILPEMLTAATDCMGTAVGLSESEQGLVRLQQILNCVLPCHGTWHQYSPDPLGPFQQGDASTGRPEARR